MRGNGVCRLLVVSTTLLLAPTAIGQEAPSLAASIEATAETAASGDTDSAAEKSERVVVTAKPSRKMIYEFFQELNTNDICFQGGSWTPRGRSCAEITYDVFDGAGKHLGQCNVPIFRLYAIRFKYTVVTFKKFDCTKILKNRDLDLVALEEVLNPRTKDGTTFRKVSVLGLDQAQELCKVSSDLCVVDLFDHTKQLSQKALRALWDGRGMRGPR
jgi:hypothetical protein